MKQKHKWIWIVPSLLLVMILATLIFYHDAVYIVFRNLTVPTYDLDES